VYGAAVLWFVVWFYGRLRTARERRAAGQQHH
jgi:hypothetical protein